MYIKVIEIFSIHFFLRLSSMMYILSLQPSQFELATFQLLHGHKWLMAIILDSSGLELKREVGTTNKDLGVISFRVIVQAMRVCKLSKWECVQ